MLAIILRRAIVHTPTPRRSFSLKLLRPMTPWSQENWSWSVAALRSKATGEIFELFVLRKGWRWSNYSERMLLLDGNLFPKNNRLPRKQSRHDYGDFSLWLLISPDNIACIVPEMICCYPTSNSHWHGTCTFWHLKHILVPHMILTCRFWQSCPSVQTYCSWNLFDLQCGTFTHGYGYNN